MSHSVLGVPSSSLSMNSRSVERQGAQASAAGQGGDSHSSASAASSLQRKLRLKTTKQYTLRTGGGGQNQLKQRPVSSMAPTSTSGMNQQARQKSNGSQDRSSQNGQNMVNVSTISAKPVSTQFKILQFNANNGQGGNKSFSTNQPGRDRSSGSAKL